MTGGVGSSTSFPARNGAHWKLLASISAGRLSVATAQTAMMPVTVALVLVYLLRVLAWREILGHVHVPSSIAGARSQPAGAGR